MNNPNNSERMQIGAKSERPTQVANVNLMDMDKP